MNIDEFRLDALLDRMGEGMKRNSPLATRFQYHLRMKREEAGLSQAGLSRAMGWASNYVGQLERGSVGASLVTVEAFAQFFKCDPGSFFQPQFRRKVLQFKRLDP